MLPTAEEIAPRFGGALDSKINTASPQVAEILAERDDD